MIGLEITFHILPNKRREFEQTARSLLGEPGDSVPPRSQAVFEQIGASDQFLWSERWESRSTLQQRLGAAGLKTLVGAIQVLGEVLEVELVDISDDPSGVGLEVPSWLQPARKEAH